MWGKVEAIQNKPKKRFRFVIAMIGRLVLSAVFFTSAAMKILSPDDFMTYISSTRLLGWLTPNVLLVVVVLVELTIAFLLLNGRTKKMGALSALLLLLTFSGFLVYSYVFNQDQSCGCFGELSSGGSIEADLIRNLVLIGLSGILIDR